MKATYQSKRSEHTETFDSLQGELDYTRDYDEKIKIIPIAFKERISESGELQHAFDEENGGTYLRENENKSK